MAGRDSRIVRIDRVGDESELIEPNEDRMAELRGAIEGSRQQIADSLVLLQDEVERRTDWRGWVREHPLEAVGAAFFIGVVIGARPYL